MSSKVYVVTNVELGWDCVIDVCENLEYAKQQYSNEKYTITTKQINTNKISKDKLIVNEFDDDKHIEILDGFMDKKDDFKKFLNFVNHFNETSKYKIDFINECNSFYFVLIKEDIFNLSTDDFWTEYEKETHIFNEYEKLQQLIMDELKKHNIVFN